MKKISIKGASWDSMFLAFSKCLTLLFGILSTKMLSTGLTLAGYGTYAQANLVLSTGTSLILFGLGDALVYFFNNKEKTVDEELKSRIVNTVFFVELVLGVILAGAVVLGQGFIANYFSNDAVKPLLWIVAILPVLSNIIAFLQILCVSVGRAKIISLYGLILTVIRIAAVCVSVYVIENLIWIYVSILIMDIISVGVYNRAIIQKNVRIKPFKISPNHIKAIVAYGLPMGIYAITSSFTRDIDKLVIGRMGGTEELAIYANCSKVLPLDFFVTSFAMVLIPYIYQRVSEGRREESIDLFSSYLKVGYYTVWTLGAMVLIAPESIISFLYADVYVAGKWVFVLYIFDNMLRFASVHLILTAAGKAKNVMIYSIISLALNLVLNMVFYSLWGMIGPAIATLVVAFVYMLLILGDTTKTIQAKWTEVFDIKDVLWFLLTLVATWCACFSLNGFMIGWGVHEYIAMICSMAAFGVAVLAIHFKRIFGVLKKINSFKL